MITEKTYTDPTGTKKTGYIKDGVTYSDKSLTNRIPDGSVVETGGGTYYKGTAEPYGVRIDAAAGGDDSYTLHGKEYKTYYGNGGSAYMDADLTTKVPFGTTMTQGGSQYYNDKNLGKVPTMGGALNDYQNQLSGVNEYLRDATAARVKANDIYTQQRINELNNREAEILQAKSDADRQSYNAYLRAINPYGANAQQTAKLGLGNSGFAESNVARLGSTYQQALAGNEQAKIDALTELASLADQARADGDRRRYDMYAEMYKNIYDAKMQAANNGVKISMQAADMLNDSKIRDEEYERDMTEARLKSSISAVENQKDAATLVAKYLLSGKLTLTQVARILNVSEDDIRQLLTALY